MAPNGCGDLNYQRSQPGSHVQRHTDTASGRPGATLGHRGGAGEASSRAPACLQTGAAACWAEAIKNGCRRTARRPRGAQRAQVEAELASCAPSTIGASSDRSVSQVEGAASSTMGPCFWSAPMAESSRSCWLSSTMHQQHLARRDGQRARHAGERPSSAVSQAETSAAHTPTWALCAARVGQREEQVPMSGVAPRQRDDALSRGNELFVTFCFIRSRN